MRETAFRIANWDTPLRVNHNRSSGRFNEAGSPPTQYFCLHPLGPWAEYMRTNELREPVDLAERRLRIWAVKLDLAGALEIDFANAARFGLTPADLVGDDHGPCRRLAERLRSERSAETIVVPNAALPGTRNVVIFGERTAIPYAWPPRDSWDLPACALAERSRPPEGVESVVRFAGEPHPELEAWTAGLSYQFADLD
jgi:hypothetical protein